MTNIISINNKKWLDLKEKTTSSIITLDEDNKILKNFLNKF